jgi:imidazoleglycerol-phosphate dehydratase
MRTAEKLRATRETKIEVTVNLDGTGKSELTFNDGCPTKFFSHMLEHLAHHSGFDLKINANSLDHDPHHLVEDVALTLGEALREALGDKSGINRYADVILPMDEALILAVVDFSGRAYCKCDVEIKDERTSDFETTLMPHFFNSLAQNAQMTLHLKMLDGKDTHHIIEAAFKACARALGEAAKINPEKQGKIPSTKGIL